MRRAKHSGVVSIIYLLDAIWREGRLEPEHDDVSDGHDDGGK